MAAAASKDTAAPAPGMVEVTVARGHTILAGDPDEIHRQKRHGPGSKVLVHEREIPRLRQLRAIDEPQTGDAPLIPEPPPVEQPVPKVEIGADPS